MPKLYNCETCGFSTKYKNRIDYHINKRRNCGIEHVNFKRLDDKPLKENDDELPSEECDVLLTDVLDDLKTKQKDLNDLKLLLETKEQTLTQRENELINRENKLHEYIQKLAKDKQNVNNNPVITQTQSHQRPPRYKFI